MLAAAAGIAPEALAGELTPEKAALVARAELKASGASHVLAVLVEIDEGSDRIDLGGTIALAIASGERTALRRARIVGGRDWVRLGAIELGLDVLRRHLLGLPVDERIDFEKV
jgi:nicotinamide-nucleotide amidase